MKGIVYSKDTKKMRYKFDTGTLPKCKSDEIIELREDIDLIKAGAVRDMATNTWINPPELGDLIHKTRYTQAKTTEEKLDIIAERLGLKDNINSNI